VKLFSENKNEKMELVYNYLTGIEFRQRVEAIAETFISLKDDLDKEKRLFAKIWAKREKQIEQMTTHILGMYGDLQGLMGPALSEIKQLVIEDGGSDQLELV
jgi:hypothetical protein